MQVTKETSVYEGWFKESSFHGPARRIVMKKFKTFRQQVRLFLCSGLQGNLKPVSAVYCELPIPESNTNNISCLDIIYDVKFHASLGV